MQCVVVRVDAVDLPDNKWLFIQRHGEPSVLAVRSDADPVAIAADALAVAHMTGPVLAPQVA